MKRISLFLYTLFIHGFILMTPVFGHAVTLTDWMHNVNDSVPLSAMTIPGTHDSGAMYEPVSGTAKTQNLSIQAQLNIGVRYLDIRLRHYNDALIVHHGSIYQHLNFDDVLIAVTDFLAIHPSETVIMEVSEEYEPANNSRTFEQTFTTYENRAQYRSFWWTHSYIPTLGDVRGKIVLLRRFSGSFGTSGGIDVTGWADNAAFTLHDSRNVPLHIQDDYQVSASSNNNKWNVIYTHLIAAQSNNDMYINFTSGYRSILGIPNITGVSNDINQRLLNHFNSMVSRRVHQGIVVSDFITEELTNAELNSYF